MGVASSLLHLGERPHAASGAASSRELPRFALIKHGVAADNVGDCYLAREPAGKRGHHMKRRRELRQLDGWAARYRLGATAGWRACRVVNMAPGGIAIEPFSLGDDEALCGQVEIEFEISERVGNEFSLLGNIRHVTRTSEGRVLLVGIEFTGLTTLQAMTLERLRWNVDFRRLTMTTESTSA